MVNNSRSAGRSTARSDGRLDAAFSALSDPTRRAILAKLSLGEATVSELARPFSVSLPAVSKHLRVLEEAGFLIRRKQGRSHVCALNPAPIRDAVDWLSHYRRFWEGRLEALSDYLEKRRKS